MPCFIVALPHASERGGNAYAASSEAAAHHLAGLDAGTVHAASEREHAFVLGNGTIPRALARRLARRPTA